MIKKVIQYYNTLVEYQVGINQYFKTVLVIVDLWIIIQLIVVCGLYYEESASEYLLFSLFITYSLLITKIFAGITGMIIKSRVPDITEFESYRIYIICFTVFNLVVYLFTLVWIKRHDNTDVLQYIFKINIFCSAFILIVSGYSVVCYELQLKSFYNGRSN